MNYLIISIFGSNHFKEYTWKIHTNKIHTQKINIQRNMYIGT